MVNMMVFSYIINGTAFLGGHKFVFGVFQNDGGSEGGLIETRLSRIETASFTIVDNSEVTELGVSPVIVGTLEGSASTKFVGTNSIQGAIQVKTPAGKSGFFLFIGV